MGANKIEVYIHLVWSTWDRIPILTPDIRELVYRLIISECNSLKCQPIVIGGVSDHVHLLTTIPTTLAIANLVKQVKGSSSHFVNHEIKPDFVFKWQGSYGAFTVSKSGIDEVANYIRRQEVHHRQKSLVPEWEVI